MAAVAVEACRRVGVALREQLSVNARGVELHLVVVANRAIDCYRHRFARTRERGRRAGVALRAADGRVRGIVYRIGVYRVEGTACAFDRLVVARHAVAVANAFVVEHLSGLVGLVAVHADRHLLRVFLPQLAVDHFSMHFLDQRVALGTRRNYVVAMDG